MDLDGADSHSIQYQNANNSVRVTDEFMQAVIDDERLEPHRPHRRRGDRDRAGPRPVPRDRRGRVGVRRPRSAVRHDDQPLAHRAEHRPDRRLEPVQRVLPPRQLGVQPREPEPACVPHARRHLRRRGLSSQPSRSSSPHRRSSSATPTTRPRRSARTRRRFRQLGIGYANLGAMLMALGLPYDSDAGRAVAASITAL